MDPFEETRVKNRYAKLLNKLKNEKFTLKELETLLLIHFQMKDNATLDLRRFKVFLHYALDMTDGTMNDRLFVTFDNHSTNWISVKEFIQGLGTLLRGSQKEQADFCFSVYDKNGEGKLGREMMFQLLRRCITRALSEDDAEEGARDLVESLFKLWDQDKDGSISLSDFRRAVREEPLLMEALGQCLPERPAGDAFLTGFAHRPPAY